MGDQVKLRYIGPFREVEVEPGDGSSHIVEQEGLKRFPPDVADNLLEEPSNWRREGLKISDEADARAVELGVNVNRIEGSGAKGAIKVSDVVEAAEAEFDDAGEEPDPPGADEDEEE